MISRLDSIEQQAESVQSIAETAAIRFFTDELSTIFAIIASGIGVFGVFGAITGVLNIREAEKSAAVRRELEGEMNDISLKLVY